jgi:boron transporter
MGRSYKSKDEEEELHSRSKPTSSAGTPDGKAPSGRSLDIQAEVPVGIVEQRVSNLAQGALCLVLLTGPFLHVLNLIPRGVYQISCLPFV